MGAANEVVLEIHGHNSSSSLKHLSLYLHFTQLSVLACSLSLAGSSLSLKSLLEAPCCIPVAQLASCSMCGNIILGKSMLAQAGSVPGPQFCCLPPTSALWAAWQSHFLMGQSVLPATPPKQGCCAPRLWDRHSCSQMWIQGLMVSPAARSWTRWMGKREHCKKMFSFL